MGFDLTPAEITIIDDAIQAIAGVLNGKDTINLSPDERRSARAVAEGRRPYLDKTYDVLAPEYTPLHPGYLNFANDKVNYNYSKQLRSRLMLMAKVMEIMEDHTLSAETLAYKWMLKFYNNAQEAQDSNMPGADTVVAELAPLFEQANQAAGENPDNG